jgi:hypothetical protein
MSEGNAVIKPLIMMNYTVGFAAPGAAATSPSLHESRIPRLALGLVGAALAAVTIAVSVILPARVHSRVEQPSHLASQAIPAATVANGAVISITVVAAREPRPSTSPLRMAVAPPGPGVSGETSSSPILRISTTAR